MFTFALEGGGREGGIPCLNSSHHRPSFSSRMQKDCFTCVSTEAAFIHRLAVQKKKKKKKRSFAWYRFLSFFFFSFFCFFSCCFGFKRESVFICKQRWSPYNFYALIKSSSKDMKVNKSEIVGLYMWTIKTIRFRPSQLVCRPLHVDNQNNPFPSISTCL